MELRHERVKPAETGAGPGEQAPAGVAGPAAIALAVLGWFAGLTALTAMTLPGASYMFAWPTLAGVLALGIALRWTSGESAVRLVTLAVAAAVVIAVDLPPMALLVSAFSVGASAVPLLSLTALGLAATTPLLEATRYLRSPMTAVGFLVAGITLAYLGT